MNPPQLVTRRRIKRFGVMQLGKISAALYGCMGLLFVPIFAFSILASKTAQAADPSLASKEIPFVAIGVAGIFIVPILHALMGFVVGVIGALLYNLVAKWFGGIEVEVE